MALTARREQSDQTVDVLFIDKYIDPAKSAAVLDRLQTQFHFSETMRQQLASGYPVVLKRKVDSHTGQMLVNHIAELGGDCWMQSCTEGGYQDRRQDNRRSVADRRLLHRGWAIVPDRRKNRERRIFFH